MSGAMSRGKGARGEREIATLLRRHLPEGYRVERFGTGETGHDLRVTPPEGSSWRWAVEVKRYQGFSVGEVLRGSSRWDAWWDQTQTQAHPGADPLLLTRGDRRPWWAWVRETDVTLDETVPRVWLPPSYERRSLGGVSPHYPIVGVRLDDLIHHLTERP